MRLEFCFPDDFRTLAKRYAAVTALRIGWSFLLGLSLNGIEQEILTSPWLLLNAWADLLFLPAEFVVPFGIDFVLATLQLGLLLGGLQLALRWALWRWRPDLAKRLASFTAPRRVEKDVLDGRRLGRPRWLPPLQMTVSIILACYAVVWLILMFDHGGLVPFAMAFRYGGPWPLIIGLAFGAVGLLFGFRFSSAARATVGSGFGIRYLDQDHGLTQRVHALAQKLDLPPPRVGLIGAVNAFAMGRNKTDAVVALGVSLVNGLAPDELDAVIGHELGHIASADMQRMQFAAGYQRMFGATIRMATTAGSGVSQKRSTNLLIVALGTLLHRTVMLGSELLMMGLSRNREFHADAVGAALTSPAAMIGALEKLHTLPSTPTPAESRYGYLMARGHGRMGRLFSTHPTLEQRKKALVDGGYVRRLPRR